MGRRRRHYLAIWGGIIFLNDTPMSKHGYVKCGYCSEYYLKGCQGHSCFLAPIDSIFGNEARCSSTICTHNVFYYDIESHLEDKFECRFQELNHQGNLVMIK